MKLNSMNLIWNTFNSNEKKQFYLLIFLMIIYSILQALGVVSILPFIYVLTNPDVIYENSILIFIKDFLSINDDQTFLIILALFSFFALLLANLSALYLMYITEVFYTSYGARLSHTLFDTYLKQNYVFFLKYDSTQLLKNTTEEIDRYIGGVILPIIKILNKSFLLIILICIMFYASIKITLIALIIFVPGYALIYSLFRKQLVRAGQEVETTIALRHKLINLALRSIKEVKLFNSESYWSKKYFIQSKNRGNLFIKSKVLGQSPQYIFETFGEGNGVIYSFSVALLFYLLD